MLKNLFRGVVVLLAVVGAYATTRFLFWPSPVIVFEDENWIVLVTQFESPHCVVVDRHGAPITDFPLDTDSDSAPSRTKTDALGRGRFFNSDPRGWAEFPTGDKLWLCDVGFTVLVRKHP